MVDFAAHFFTIHAIKIGFQKYYILPGKRCPWKSFIYQLAKVSVVSAISI